MAVLRGSAHWQNLVKMVQTSYASGATVENKILPLLLPYFYYESNVVCQPHFQLAAVVS
jgi:hypothetical protein